jgi:putative ABC transport system permease protein
MLASLRTCLERLRTLFNRRRLKEQDDEFTQEIQAHLDLLTEENKRRGMSAEEAALDARLRLGGFTQLRESRREMSGLPVLEMLLQDGRYGLRTLRKAPGFTLVVVLILALGIGANSMIFSAVNAVLLRSLPYPRPDRLAYVNESNPGMGWPRFGASPANFLDWRERNQVFSRLVAFGQDSSSVTLGDVPEQWKGLAATQGFFEALGAHAAIGRTFTDEDFVGGRHHVMVLSDGLWRSAFASDPNIVGRSISLDGESTTILGVMPAGFAFGGENCRYWMPYAFDSSEQTARGAHYLRVMGRLRDGVTLAQAQEEMISLAAQMERQYPKTNHGWTTRVESMQASDVRNVRSALWVLLGAVGLVLLIACANVANMLLARASGKQKEIAIRLALGARRHRIVLQLLNESLLLALAGGALGLVLASWGSRILADLPLQLLPRASTVHVDTSVLAFTFLLSLATGVLFGLAPALRASRGDLAATVKEGASSGRGGRAKLSSALVVAEVALAMILLVGSGLLIRSFARLISVPPGVTTAARLTFSLNLPAARYAKPEQWKSFYERAQQNLKALPGVTGVTMTSLLPVSGDNSLWSFGINGQTNSTSLPSATYYLVGPGYLKMMGVPLLAGRDFVQEDSATGRHVVIINDFLARKMFSGSNPIGQGMQLGRNYDVVREIVGVAGSVKQDSLQEGEAFQVYEPFEEMPRPGMTFIVNTAGTVAGLLPAVQRAIQQVDVQQPVTQPRTMEEVVEESVTLPRFRTVLLGAFAGLALVLALFGLYSVLSYTVEQQVREIGIRMALGARPRDVYRLVVRHGMAMVACGVVIGLAGAALITRFLVSFLFEIKPHDPQTMIAVVLLFAAVALVACYVPARRATRVDPMVALRHE